MMELNRGFTIRVTRALAIGGVAAATAASLTAQHYRRLRGSLKGTKAMEVFMSERKREREL